MLDNRTWKLSKISKKVPVLVFPNFVSKLHKFLKHRFKCQSNLSSEGI